ncbi:MAG: metal ABC transporter permease [Pseudomonadota bacterium]
MLALVQALTLSAGYNAAVVTVGAAILGVAAGACGTFMFLRKRALVSDALAHATLPGIVIAFMVMVGFGGDGRDLFGLLAGAAISATIGLLAVDAMVAHTRLSQDAAIGAVLSVFFGFGIVCLTVVQTMTAGRQAGLEAFLLGSTAGMLYGDAVTIAAGAALCLGALLLLRRAMTVVAFDPQFAAASGFSVRLVDIAMMALVLAVTVIGLRVVGLVLIVALLIIPPVSARFWTDRAGVMVVLSAAFGGLAGYGGSAISAVAPALPTGSIVVLAAFAIFSISFLFSPRRGLLAAALRRRGHEVRVHRRQGLLALSKGEPVLDAMTLAVLRRERLIRRDGVPTELGRTEAAKARLDEARWIAARIALDPDALASQSDVLTPIEDAFTADQIATIDRHLQKPRAV